MTSNNATATTTTSAPIGSVCSTQIAVTSTEVKLWAIDAAPDSTAGDGSDTDDGDRGDRRDASPVARAAADENAMAIGTRRSFNAPTSTTTSEAYGCNPSRDRDAPDRQGAAERQMVI